ncbi:MAG: phosphate regulon transcriptional regulator PhoB [Gammaproteobacteria bacterium]|nr:phosphate regulon transcriptional regulator PhoB [Gammaproteobacteria bacterium]
MPCILVVDDEPAIREMVGIALTSAGYDMLEAGNTTEARQLIVSKSPDLVLLDWMLPGQTGFDLARQLHNDHSLSSPPVIMLTARDREADKVAALEAGADDYISKPFSISELHARIKAVLRRTARHSQTQLLECNSLSLDPSTRRVTANGINLELSPLEFRLLFFFMNNPEQVYSRGQLLEQVWGTIHVEERTVDVHVRRLRKLLEPSGHDRLIQTVRGSGYMFSKDT